MRRRLTSFFTLCVWHRAARMWLQPLHVMPGRQSPAARSLIPSRAMTTLTAIGARFGVYPRRSRRTITSTPRDHSEVGRELRIDNRHIIPTDGRRLAKSSSTCRSGWPFYSDGDRVFAYPIAVGRATWQTPAGTFTVVRKEENPAWHVPASIRAESARAGHPLPLVVAPGPQNPLGQFWIGLSLAGIGIHGTPAQSSIYQATTHGCIRLPARSDRRPLFARDARDAWPHHLRANSDCRVRATTVHRSSRRRVSAACGESI